MKLSSVLHLSYEMLQDTFASTCFSMECSMNGMEWKQLSLVLLATQRHMLLFISFSFFPLCGHCECSFIQSSEYSNTTPPPSSLRFSISEFFSNQEKHGDCLKHQFYKTQSTSNVLATICLSYCHPLGKSPYAFPPHTIKPFHIHSSTHFQLKELTVVTN